MDDTRPDPHQLASNGKLQELQVVLQTMGVDTRDCDDNTPLHPAALEGHAAVVNFLLQAGANANAQNRHLVTPLHYACARGNAEVVMLLLAGGAYANARQEDGMTALHHAARRGDLSVARALVDASADTNAVSHLDGWTALHYAQERGNVEIVELLLKKGASPHVQDPQGRTVGIDSIFSFTVPPSTRQAICAMINELKRPPPMM